MRRTRLSILALAAALFAGLPASGLVGGVTAQDNSALGKDLDAILADPSLTGADVGLVVKRADTGEPVYSSQSARRSQPASTAKLVTSAAALEILGPNHTFSTTLQTTGKTVGRVLNGDLHLRGTGDPTMLAADYDALAASVAASGVRLVRGNLVADDTWFDAVRLATGWAWDDEPYYYNAQISALTVSPDTDYDAGSIIVRVEPGVAGAPAKVTTTPPTSYVKIANTAVTGAAGSTSQITVDRQRGGNVFTVTGSLPAGGAAVTEYMAVWEPTGLVSSLLRDALAKHGVKVIGQTVTGATPTGARTLAEHKSIPLAQLQVPFLKLSNNMHAEILVKTAGRAVFNEGTWDAGLRAVDQKLGGLGIDPATLELRDGSGLSRMDHISPDQLASLLVATRTKPWFQAWYDALPIAGAPGTMVGGTLRNRMKGTPAEGNVRAKTGSLTGVSGLAGYVTTADGKPLVFAMLSNNVLGSSPKRLEDAVAVRLAGHRDGATGRIATLLPEPRTIADDTRQGSNYLRDLQCSWLKAC